MPSPRERLRADAAAGPVVAALLSLVAAAQALRIWDWRPGTPLSLTGDAPQLLTQVRAIMDGNWYTSTDRVGAPFGMNQAWFTTADVFNFASIKVLGWVTDSPATAGAIFFLLGFPAAALAAYWLSRRLDISRPGAVTVGVLFAVLPGHQLWFSHLWLAAYWMVPLAVWLVMTTARGGQLWPSRSDLRSPGAAGRAARWAGARTVAIVIVVGLADVYYVAFTLLLLGVVLVFRLGSGSRAASLLPGAIVTGAVGALCGASLFVATRGRAGDLVTGALPAQRVIGESETYAGKIIELVLPWYEHRAAPLRFLSFAYGVATQASVERPALGIVALSGVAAITWMALTSLSLGRRVPAPWGLLAALTFVSLAFYTRGGLGSVVALFFTPQIRTWSRFVVLIGLFGLLAVGIWVTRLGRRRGRRAAWVAAALLLTLGVLDQTNPGVAPNYAALRAQQAELTSYTRAIGDSVGGGCAVFQLPVVSFPEEAPPGVMGDYDHLLPSVVAPAGLHWSYGAIRGTARGDWQLALPIEDHGRLLEDLAAAGFCAVEIDSDGYVGATDPSAATAELLGAPVAKADREHLAAYDLRAAKDQLGVTLGAAELSERRDAVLRPVVVSLAGSLVDTSQDRPFQWTGPAAVLTAANMGDSPVDVTLSFELSGNGPRERVVTMTGAGLSSRELRVSATSTQTVTATVSLPPGRTELRLKSTGDIDTVPGTEGREFASLKVADLRVTTGAGANAATLQQFAQANPPSLR